MGQKYHPIIELYHHILIMSPPKEARDSMFLGCASVNLSMHVSMQGLFPHLLCRGESQLHQFFRDGEELHVDELIRFGI